MSNVLISSLFVGIVYGLLAVGLVVVYRASRAINFAYGSTGMIAAFVFAEMREGLGPSRQLGTADHGVVLPIVVGLAVGVGLGAITEMSIVRPLRSKPRLQVMVGTLALGSLLVVVADRRWGTSVQSIQPLIGGNGFKVGEIAISPTELLIAGCSIVLLGSLWVLYRFTPFGLKLRAAAVDPFAAGLVGVDINRVSMASWALAGGLAAASAILIAPLESFSTDFMTSLMIRAIAAALVGGLTSIPGAFVTGIALGIGEGVIAYESPVTGITDAAIAGLIILFVMIRPGGLIRSSY